MGWGLKTSLAAVTARIRNGLRGSSPRGKRRDHTAASQTFDVSAQEQPGKRRESGASSPPGHLTLRRMAPPPPAPVP